MNSLADRPAAPREALAAVWHDTAGDPCALANLTLTGVEPALPSSFAVGTAAQVSIAALAIAARDFHMRRGGPRQGISVDMRAAAIECRSERYAAIDDKPMDDLWDDLAGAYRCGDGRYVRLHTNFAHHRAGILELLGCEGTRAAVTAALARQGAEGFESEATHAGLCVAMMRSSAEWHAHPASAAVRVSPLVRITRIADAPPLALRFGTRPLSGVRVLEMTRIIAGPVAGRSLAAYGADVLRVISPAMPTLTMLDADTGRGKRSAYVDIATPHGRATFLHLARGTDVVLQSYRPGVMARRGVATGDLLSAAGERGLVVASLSAYGNEGPWGGKR